MRIPAQKKKTYVWRWTAALTGVAVLALALVVGSVVRQATPVRAAAIVVDNLDDDPGAAKSACTAAANDCSLRGALSVANSNGANDTITFATGLTGAISSTVAFTISEVGKTVVIDGPSSGGVPQITIDCGGNPINGFDVTSAGNTIRDLSIINCVNGILIDGSGADNNLIAGNFIGLAPAGAAAPNGDGIHFTGGGGDGADGNVIGGSAAADRNVISGNNLDGIDIEDAAADNTVIRGNYIGTDPTGMVANPNGGSGIWIGSAGVGTVVGGTAAGQGNLISHNSGDGVRTHAPTTIQGNLIGLASDGITPMANGGDGVDADSGATDVLIGDTGTSAPGPGAGANVIAHNGGAGVAINGAATQRIKVARNSIFENGGQAVDLADDGAITECPPPGAGGDGANNNVDCPAITSVTYTGSNFLVSGTANVGEFLTGSRIDVYEVVADAFGAGEGKTWLAAFNVVNDGVTASWGGTICVNGPTQISAIATDVNGNSSEFALNANVPLGACVAATPTFTPTSTPGTPTATSTPTPTNTPTTPTATNTAIGGATATSTPGGTETVALAKGCNPVASTWPNGTAIATIQAAISPGSALVSIWGKYDPTTGKWQGFAPGVPAGVSDLTSLNRLDAFFICMSASGTLTRPKI